MTSCNGLHLFNEDPLKTLFFFALLSVPVLIASLKPLLHYRSHGFPRFFAWEGILWLFVNNYSFWFRDPLGVQQLVSWLLLVTSVYPAAAGFIRLQKARKTLRLSHDPALFEFEKTSELVQDGIYRHIRHPLYGSLLLLTWGILLKNPEASLIAVALAVSILLYITARRDESECIAYFGEPYRKYMKKSRMFIPFVF